jgi:hypothetical protein
VDFCVKLTIRLQAHLRSCNHLPACGVDPRVAASVALRSPQTPLSFAHAPTLKADGQRHPFDSTRHSGLKFHVPLTEEGLQEVKWTRPIKCQVR